jgi:hypothetical protein
MRRINTADGQHIHGLDMNDSAVYADSIVTPGAKPVVYVNHEDGERPPPRALGKSS